MSNERHYTNSIARPVSGSRYEFYVEGFLRLENSNNSLSWVWGGPLHDIGDPIVNNRPLLEHLNRRAERGRAIIRAQATEYLSDLGVPTSHPLFEKLVTDRILLVRLALKELDDRRPTRHQAQRDLDGRYPKDICWRVIAAADAALGFPGPKALAEHLNADRSRQFAGLGLDPDHIARALRAHKRDLVTQFQRVQSSLASRQLDPRSHVEQLATAYWVGLISMFRNLDRLRRLSIGRQEFRQLSGAALIDKMDQRHCLEALCDRLADRYAA